MLNRLEITGTLFLHLTISEKTFFFFYPVELTKYIGDFSFYVLKLKTFSIFESNRTKTSKAIIFVIQLV